MHGRRERGRECWERWRKGGGGGEGDGRVAMLGDGGGKGKRDGGDQLRALAPYICTDLRIYISGGIQTQRSAVTCARTINTPNGVSLC